MENMNVRQAILFLAKELGFEKEPHNTQDLVELALAILQQGVIEFTEDDVIRMSLNVSTKDGITVSQYYDKDDNE